MLHCCIHKTQTSSPSLSTEKNLKKKKKTNPRVEEVGVRLAKDIRELRPFIRSTSEELEKAFSAGKKVFLEGTQGTGLSLYHGLYPHVTSRDTTVAGCLAEAGISRNRVEKGSYGMQNLSNKSWRRSRDEKYLRSNGPRNNPKGNSQAVWYSSKGIERDGANIHNETRETH